MNCRFTSILAALPKASRITWLSQLVTDDFAEYRDGDFLVRLGHEDLVSALQTFWPARGPQWDALARTDRGDLLLIETRAHFAELCSPPTAASAASRATISTQLERVATSLGPGIIAPPGRTSSTNRPIAWRS